MYHLCRMVSIMCYCISDMNPINQFLEEEESMAKAKVSSLPTRCMRCLHEIKSYETYYNVKNVILCEVCFALPPDESEK